MRGLILIGGAFAATCLLSALLHPVPAATEFHTREMRVEAKYRGAVYAGDVK